VRAWGWSALVQHFGGASDDAEYHKHFKLRLAPGAPPDARGARSARELIAKYLTQLGALATDAVRKQLGDHISAADIQWCITVPAIWGDDAKATMRRCMEDAGLVQRAASSDDAENVAPAGGSPHALLMVLEPEAASLYCQSKLDKELLAAVGIGDNIMVVDCGGGTTDIVVHRRVAQEGGEGESGRFRLREVAKGTGDCCGGTVVDAEFLKLLHETSPVFSEYAQKHPVEVRSCAKRTTTLRC
jgi:molecular chaperone DnaK (HSP70)